MNIRVKNDIETELLTGIWKFKTRNFTIFVGEKKFYIKRSESFFLPDSIIERSELPKCWVFFF